MNDIEWIEREARRVFSACVSQGCASVPSERSADDDADELGTALYEIALVEGAAQVRQRGLVVWIGNERIPIAYADIRTLEGLGLRELMRATRSGMTTLVTLTLLLEDRALSLSMQLPVYTALFSFVQPVVARMRGGA